MTPKNPQQIPAQAIKRIVLVGGCFDLLHFGHTEFLREAKKLGDHLIVALESDENVKKTKGESRPIHAQRQRRSMLEALSSVDEVISLPIMKTDEDYKTLVMKVHPNVIAATEGDPILEKKKILADTIQADFKIIQKIHTPSTSQLAKLLGLE